MRHAAGLLMIGVTGLVAGALTTLSVQAPAAPLPPPTEAPSPTTPPSPAAPPHVAAPDDRILLVWTASGLPQGFPARVAALPHVDSTTTVAGGRVDLVASHDALGTPVDEYPGDWVVPLDALAIDPTTYADFVSAPDRATIEELEPGAALLGTTSAELRRLDAGDTVTLTGGHTLRIAGVVDDAVVGAAELVVAPADARRLGIATDRFMLVGHRGERAELEGAIRDAADGEVRVRGPGETPWLRHGDAVLPQALVKAQFGEFTYRPATSGRDFVQDPAWVDDHIVTLEVPLLGRVRCHRGLAKQVRGALEEIVDRGLGHLVDPEAFEGCHNPRLVGTGGMPSRHAWGIALDLNADTNPTGLTSGQDPRLVETFARWGLTWGGFWLVPDPMHVEYIGPPAPEPAKVVRTD